MTISDDVRAPGVLTRDEAIDRMKAGLPCETCCDDYPWRPTSWSDFDWSSLRFRKPPDPRRVAREWENVVRIEHCHGANDHSFNSPIHVREVLPGDVVLQKMSEATAWGIACKQAPDIGFMSPRYGVMAFARALGLLGEGS